MKTSTASRLGLWASVFVTILGVVYLFVLIASMPGRGFALEPTPAVQLAGGIITFLTAPGLLVIFTSIRYVNEKGNEVLGSLGISFIVLFAATVSINRFVQLTVIQQSLPDVPADLNRFLPYAPGSVMLALEILGWGFFSSLAALCVAPLFSSSRLNLAIRWLWVLYAVFSFMSAIGFATDTPIMAGGFIAWGPILLVLTILLCFHFRNYDKQVVSSA